MSTVPTFVQGVADALKDIKDKRKENDVKFFFYFFSLNKNNKKKSQKKISSLLLRK